MMIPGGSHGHGGHDGHGGHGPWPPGLSAPCARRSPVACLTMPHDFSDFSSSAPAACSYMPISICICVHTSMYIHICIYTYVYTHMYIHICIYTYVYTHMYIHICIYAYVDIHTWLSIYVYIHYITYIYISMRTHTRTVIVSIYLKHAILPGPCYPKFASLEILWKLHISKMMDVCCFWLEWKRQLT